MIIQNLKQEPKPKKRRNLKKKKKLNKRENSGNKDTKYILDKYFCNNSVMLLFISVALLS